MIVGALPLLCAAAEGDGGVAPALGEGVSAGRFALEFRPRYNRLDEEGYEDRSQGGTLRVIAGWHSAPWNGVRFTVEAIHADHVGTKGFNDDPAQFSTSRYPLLPDPRYTGVNQVHADYSGIDGLRLRLGRQLVRIDNQRWMSDNDFRQIPQLFDGITAVYTGLANTELLGGYFNRIRDTSGEMQDAKVGVLHAAWNPAPGHALSAYAYFHDQPQGANFTGFADNSYRVVGARAEGVMRVGALEVRYLAEAAQQKPYADGDARIDARYWRLGAGLAAAAWTVRIDHETKGSNSGQYGLQTPLTDFYAFNGWTLHFFTTPAAGLRDRWLTGRYAVGPVTLYAEAHRFHSDYGAADLGRETDVGLTWEAMPEAIVRLQHARYDPAGGAVGRIRKTWLTLTCTF